MPSTARQSDVKRSSHPPTTPAPVASLVVAPGGRLAVLRPDGNLDPLRYDPVMRQQEIEECRQLFAVMKALGIERVKIARRVEALRDTGDGTDRGAADRILGPEMLDVMLGKGSGKVVREPYCVAGPVAVIAGSRCTFRGNGRVVA